MSEFVFRVGSRSAQGLRSNNEDRLLVDMDQKLFLVADGMGGQELGELASGMAVEIIPRIVEKRLAEKMPADKALIDAMHHANQAIVDAARSQPVGRRMGTTAVCKFIVLAHADAARRWRTVGVHGGVCCHGAGKQA